MQLQLVGGNDTLVLSGGGGIAGCTYAPQVGDGSVCAESAQVILRTTQSTAIELSRRLERIFSLARRRQQFPGGGRIYVEYRAHSGLALARSEILDGKVELSTSPRLRDFRVASPTVALDISWQRRDWWEAAVEEIPVSSSTVSAGTGGRTINNRHDVALQNWIEAAASQFATDALPPATIFSITSTPAVAIEQMFFGVNHGAIFNPLVEAESRLYGQHTVVTSSSASGGSILRIGLGSGGTATATWSLDAARVQAIGGRLVEVLLRQATGANATAQLRILDANSKPLWVNPPAQMKALFGQLTDLGTVQLPPGGEPESPGLGSVLLQVQFVGSGTFDIDYLFLLPQDAGYFSEDSVSIPAGGYVEVGSHPAYAAVFNSSNQMQSPVWMSGRTLFAAPTGARIYALISRDTGAWPADQYSLRLFVRRRRRTI